ncbi:MAG: hypothetical protein RBQ77_01095 [Candidatus Methanomethylophilaceae archaeon]|jgi:hypothetical protein|nr:hypothetical protein [Candidatus Methanomethylophilaceae archaeon]NLF34308.1 hypothetical protein [Thermoplasmatales archaeon]
MNETKDIGDLQTEIKVLKSEVRELREFIKVLYSLVMEDEEEEYAPSGFSGGIEVGRFNT